MKNWRDLSRLVPGLFMTVLVIGCSSSSDEQAFVPDPDGGGSGGGGGSSGSGAGGRRDAAGTSAVGTGGGTATGTGTGSGTGGGDGSGPISDECKAYCDCYQERCAVFVAIPTGQACLDFCTTFTADQYGCRFGMCFYNSQGPRVNNNNHCQHAVGIDECK